MKNELAALIRKANNEKIGLDRRGVEVGAIDDLIRYLVTPKSPKDPDRKSRKSLKIEIHMLEGNVRALKHSLQNAFAQRDAMRDRLNKELQPATDAAVRMLLERRKLRQQFSDLEQVATAYGILGQARTADGNPITFGL